MKKIIISFMAMLMLLGLSGCQAVTKSFGGSYTLELPEGEKLINVTWKDSSLWVLTRQMKDTDEAEIYQFKESSNLGVLEGTVTIKENK